MPGTIPEVALCSRQPFERVVRTGWLSIETLFRVEGGYLGHVCIVVDTDMRIRRYFPVFVLFKLVGESQEVRIWMTFENIHP